MLTVLAGQGVGTRGERYVGLYGEGGSPPSGIRADSRFVALLLLAWHLPIEQSFEKIADGV